jgi:hypothetical protein
VKNYISIGLISINTITGVILYILPRDFYDYLFLITYLVIAISTKRSLLPFYFFLRIFIPIIIPLFIIQSVLNPVFTTEFYFFNFISFKPDGFKFFVSISQQLSIFLSISCMWLLVCRDSLLDWLIFKNFPLVVCATYAQAVSMIGLIERRGLAVYKAQQARGIQTSKGLFKLKAMISVMFPVIATIINETDWRVTALISRGFYSTKMTSQNIPLFHKKDLYKIFIIIFPLFLKSI